MLEVGRPIDPANNRNDLNSLVSIDSDWTRQLIDIWFPIHPFSVLVSKTLLLKSIKDVYDQALVAILLSDAKATLASWCRG
ncbi:uncharacterized protein BO66DRAFT_394799 [Aspergillus aculeatinus CBS 121060]|uniref:Uncharacterized protein n=1 Tax=Aspergillus aculeatinus CBS 121060 TaxID=1448322 RepID=A0ACD1GYF2_9EURO|nr:hypothetical protein BO66DRAFT_394799 [Aspergillus aculeatinus CBS 121060]RAH66284.1 hypothetical protein BO66DRAFT_394799 [Aspergillus aculeatinus CBS 121060]